MKVMCWYNLSQKKYEATEVGRGRPIKQDASVEERAKSKREFFTGKTKDEALRRLAKAHGVKMDEVVASLVKDSRIIYKGKREHPYTRKAKETTVAKATTTKATTKARSTTTKAKPANGRRRKAVKA